MSKNSISRRNFVQTTSAAAALSMAQIVPASAKGANERIQIGVIGCGNRGFNALMHDIHRYDKEENVAITAVCDVWRQHREKAAETATDWYKQEPKQFEDYRDVLALDDIDAVTIATPDHLHATILKAAAKAGKDAYCEKPLAMNMEELTDVVDTVKKEKRVVQLGTQLRSWSSFTGCRKVVQDGVLGQIIRVVQVRSSYEPYWNRFARPLTEADTNWKLFLGDRKYRPFDADQHSAWYGYRDFTQGSISNLMCHFIDLVHYITGAQFPEYAVTLAGNYVWKNQRTCPDAVQTVLTYPEGFMVSYNSSFGNGFGNYTRFFGTQGAIDATEWREPFMTGEGTEHPDKIKEKKIVPDVPITDHMQNWLQCLRTREQPNASIDAGYQHAVACLLADAAMVQERKMTYDAVKREIKPA